MIYEKYGNELIQLYLNIWINVMAASSSKNFITYRVTQSSNLLRDNKSFTHWCECGALFLSRNCLSLLTNDPRYQHSIGSFYEMCDFDWKLTLWCCCCFHICDRRVFEDDCVCSVVSAHLFHKMLQSWKRFHKLRVTHELTTNTAVQANFARKVFAWGSHIVTLWVSGGFWGFVFSIWC